MSVIIKTAEMAYRDDSGNYHGINSVAEKKLSDQLDDLDAAIATRETTISGDLAQMSADILVQETRIAGDLSQMSTDIGAQETRINNSIAQMAADIGTREARIDADIAQMTADVEDIEDQRQTMIASIASVAGQGTDTTLTQTGVAADAKAAGDNINELKSALNVVDGEVNTYTLMTRTATADNWKLTDTGTSSYDASYRIDKYAVKAGDYVKVVSSHKFQFQTGANAGVDPKVGDTYGAGTFNLQVPNTAKYLLVSYAKSGTATTVDKIDRLPDFVNDINNRLKLIFDVTWTDGAYINNSGAEVSNASFTRTGFIALSDVCYGIYYELFLDSSGNIVSFYDEDQNYISGSGVAGAGNTTKKTGITSYPDNAKYVRFSHCLVSGGISNTSPVLNIKDIVGHSNIGYNAVGTDNLKAGAVSKGKCAFIAHDPNSNYIDKTKYTNGYINSSGQFVSNSSWRATDYLVLQPDTQYYSSQLHGGYCAFYKADKTVIAAYGASSYTVSSFTTPALTAYARFSINADSYDPSEAWVFTQNEKPTDYAYILDGVRVSSDIINPCDYTGNEISVFNKILCVGDSMTEGTFNHLDSGSTQWVTYSKYAYPKFLQKLTGVEVTNIGHGGKTSVQWYDLEKNNDLSGYDCAIIQLGINDYGTYSELGDDTKTAFQSIITKLKTDNKNIKIFVANIIPATSYSSSGYKDYSDDLLEWLETEYASDDDVIPVDIQQYGHTGDSSAYNCGHLSALGYHRLAEDWKGFISWYISKHKDVFREVQFIGTNYWYENPNP